MKANFLLLIVAISITLTACGESETDNPTSAATRNAVDAEQGDEHAEDEHGAADEHGGAGERVALTNEQIEAAGIGLAQAGSADIRETLSLYGVVAPNAERVREVTARFPGVIRSVVKSVGDSVRQGETLATVESNESLQTYSVVAPLTGVVTRRSANPGEHAGDQPLFTVADLGTVWVELSLFPRDLAKVRVGQSVRVRNSGAGRTAQGKVVYVAPFGSSTNQTLTARVLLENTQGHWPPGLYVTADVTLASASAPLAVSSEALQTLDERTVVFVRGEKGFEPRAVELGRSDGDVVEVLAGLEPGEIYATRNSFILKAELGKGEAEHGH